MIGINQVRDDPGYVREFSCREVGENTRLWSNYIGLPVGAVANTFDRVVA
jgi:hypothetical protein